MKESVKQQMAESIKHFRMPRYNELPNEGLYLEQTTQYINHALAPLNYFFHDKQLCKERNHHTTY